MKLVSEILKLVLLIVAITVGVGFVKFELAATTLAEVSTESAGAVHQAVNVNSIKAGVVLDKAKASIVDLDRVILSIGGTSRVIRKAAKAQADYWDQNGAQSVELFKKANKVADGLSDTLGQATKTLAAVEDTTKKLQAPIASIDTAVKSVSKITDDPNIPKLIENVNGIAANGKKITDRLAAPVTEVKKIAGFIWHSFLTWVK